MLLDITLPRPYYSAASVLFHNICIIFSFLFPDFIFDLFKSKFDLAGFSLIFFFCCVIHNYTNLCPPFLAHKLQNLIMILVKWAETVLIAYLSSIFWWASVLEPSGVISLIKTNLLSSWMLHQNRLNLKVSSKIWMKTVFGCAPK